MSTNGKKQTATETVKDREDRIERERLVKILGDWVFLFPTAEDAERASRCEIPLVVSTYDEVRIAYAQNFIIVSHDTPKGLERADEIKDELIKKKAKEAKVWPLSEYGSKFETLDDWCQTHWLENDINFARPWEKTADEKEAAREAAVFYYANFSARIVRETIRHEGEAATRAVDLEVIHRDGSKRTIAVPAKDFESMSWVTTELGLKYAVDPGKDAKSKLQHAIRTSSYFDPRNQPELKHVYTSLGWVDIDGQAVYLHAGGGIGADGPTGVEVDLCPELKQYVLPAPNAKQLKAAVAAVLAIPGKLGAEAAAAAATIMSLPFRSVLGPSSMTPHFSGTSGCMKTSTAVVTLQFFAPSYKFDDAMPLNWSTTQAGTERVRNIARDSLVVIDNFIADGDNPGRELSKANSVINGQGDLVGKSRMNADGSTPTRRDPHCSMISTGECEFTRKSALGRALTIELRPGMIELEKLIECHADGERELYAQAVASYLKWLASPGRLATQRSRLNTLAMREQAEAAEECPDCHPRHCKGVGEWIAAFSLFLDFAVEAKAIKDTAAIASLALVRRSLLDVLKVQAEIQVESDPGETFLELLQSLLSAKRVFLSAVDGGAPHNDNPGRCGWVVSRQGAVEVAPGAMSIGWIDAEFVYLNPNAAHAAVERHAREVGKSIGPLKGVHRRLSEMEKIKTYKSDRRIHYTPQKLIEGDRKRVLWLLIKEIFPEKSPEEGEKEGGAF